MASGLFAVGSRAMGVNAAMLEAASHNISNANTEGYSRQEVKLATESSQASENGFIGRGVRVATIDRASDPYLSREANQSTSIASADQARLEKLRLLESVLPLGKAGIGYAAGEMLNSFVDVANQPQDLSARQVTLARAEDLASRTRAAATELIALQEGVVADLRGAAAQVNGLTKQIANLNAQVRSVIGIGHAPNDLMDQRDLLIKKLNEIIQVSTVNAEDGTTAVFLGGGQRLVLGSDAETLLIARNEFDSAMGRLVISSPSGTVPVNTDTVQGGTISGLLKVQNEDLVQARNMLGQMTSALSWRLNQQQALGIDLSTPPSNGDPIFSIGEPQVLASNKNDSSLTDLPLNLTVVDGRFLQASDYSLVPDTNVAGQYIVTRLSDGKVSTLTDGSTFDGLQLNITDPIFSGDQFLLRPVGASAIQMQRVLDRPTGLAIASPFTAIINAANTGTASVKSLSISSAPSTSLPPTSGTSVHIVFTSSAGEYEIQAPLGTALETGTWQPGQAIQYNGFDLKINGVPNLGDVIQVEKTTYPQGNNGNALAILALRDEDLVGRQTIPPNTVSPGNTVTSAYSQVIGTIGVLVQSAKTTADISDSLAKNANDILINKLGVNLDEEAARLIQFQQSYQASAKILQVAQAVFDIMLTIGS
jgi:flagellar hook-associated protein 1 FlgK